MTSRYCSPQRPGETNEEFGEREIRARDQWRQNFVNDYHTRKETRLLSPYSDSDMDDEIMGAEVQFVEQCMQIDAGLATIEDFIKPTRYTPPPPGPHGKSLSELDPEERECMGLPPMSEADKKLRAELVARDAEAAVGHERKRLPDDISEELPLAKDTSQEPPLAEKTRTKRKDTIPFVPRDTRARSCEPPPPSSPHGKSLSELDPEERECMGLPPMSEADKKLRAELVARDAEAAAGHKRKRLPEDTSEELLLAKKTRTLRKDTTRTRSCQLLGTRAFDITSIEQPPTAVKTALSNSKRKRASEEDFHELALGKRARTISKSQHKSTPEESPEGSSNKSSLAKRKRTTVQVQLPPVSPMPATTGTVSSLKSRSERMHASQPLQCSTLLPPRITRAHRRQLSGIEAQLLQLGHDNCAQVASPI